MSDWIKETVYMEYTDSRGKVHQIAKRYIPKQSDAYEKAKEKRDAIAMHYLHLPPIDRKHWQIQAAIDMIELPYQCEERTKRLMLELDMQEKLEKAKSRKKYWLLGFIPVSYEM